ncbi:MAG: peptidoglycan binding domain-containing protein, partial [Oscillospiraceae bacterium]|nr:peptidoglycan binding domain-containing protein [Oscillospiraceae bacterium]
MNENETVINPIPEQVFSEAQAAPEPPREPIAPELPPEQPPQNETKRPGRPAQKHRGRIALIAALAVAGVIAAGAAAGVAYVNRVNTIFPNVSVDGLDIGGLTLSETAAKLSENGYGDLSGKEVSVELPLDYTLTVSAEDVCTDTPVTDIALMAWDTCRSGGALGDALTYLRCSLGSGMELQSGAAMTVDREAVQAAVDSAAAEVRMAILDSELVVGEDSIRVVKGAKGVNIDTREVAELISKALEEENYTTLDYRAEIQPSTDLDLEGIYNSIHTEASDAHFDKETFTVIPETVGVSFDVEAARRSWDSASYGEQVII